MNNTLENDKRIAKFMGLVVKDKNAKSGQALNFNGLLIDYETFGEGWLTYSTDWNKLMGVVEKIENSLPDDYNVPIIGRTCYIEIPEHTIEGYSENSKLEAVYNAVILYLDWYEENVNTLGE